LVFSTTLENIQTHSKDLFSPSDFTSDAKLDGEYLLGYHCQRSALYTKKSTESDPEDIDAESSDD